MNHKIIITPSSNGNPRHNSRGAQYDAAFEGETIVTGSTQPLLDACRVLKARNLSGAVEIWDKVLPYYRFRADIEKAAGQNIREGDGPPRYERFKSFTRHGVLETFSKLQATHNAHDNKSRSTAHPAPVPRRLAEPPSDCHRARERVRLL